ncbi:MAG: ABC transporter ATP-binding protein [Parcubacteria group bacterium]|jgi:ABC-type polysaccharide/polyol phosphate transport system ATPase subunit|nr:ABC transporter ATP-binding protein [Candidatus Moranbacteria bacterium]
MNSKKHKNYEFALEVKDVSKIFKVPHRKIDSMRGAFVNAFKKNYYEEFNALEDVSFKVKKGEFLGIIGHNGAGKSTLLKILASVYKPTSGKIKINGMISPFLELGIGFNPELSGRDNIYLNATVLGLTKKEIEKKFDEIVAFAELEDFIDQQIKNYSSGMQARLAFSVSIHANREILLMDEVLAVGDSAFQEKCLDIFRSYKDKGRTVILVTHSIATVREYCDRALLLDKGKILDIGDVDEVCDAYIRNNMTKEERKELEKKERIEREERERKEKIEEERKGGDKEEEKEKEKDAQEEKEKVVEITKVEFLDKNGKEKDTFKTGDSLDIKISFKIDKQIKLLNFGIGLHSISGGQVFGYNTQMDKYDIRKDKEKIVLHFENFPILKGEYFVNIACWGDDEQEHYDYKPKFKILKMHSSGIKNNYRGFCDIEHKWV